jgi:membrane associated rhomboid family serine protease
MFKIKNFKSKLITTLVIVGVVWFFYLLSLVFPSMLHLGIMPRTWGGLWGIIMSPLLHANLSHILSNTIPLAVFIFVLLIFYERMAIWVVLGSVILGGFMVWLMARSANHIGASGLIYALAAFLITSGLIRKKWLLMLVSIILGVAYAGLIWGVMPGIAGPNVSWEGHLFGAIAGVGLAFLFKPVPTGTSNVTVDPEKLV